MILAHFFKSFFRVALIVIVSVWGHFSVAKDSFPNELVSGQNRLVHFDLPSQLLNHSLIEFALQADINIVVPSDVISQQRSTAVIGKYRVADALNKFLENTSLMARFENKSASWIVEMTPRVSPENIESFELESIPDEEFYIDEVIVRAGQYPFKYHTIAHSSQLHSGMTIFDSARFLNVLPRQLIEDQQPQDLNDLLKYSSGITPADGLAESNDDFYIRGFPRHAIYLDGFRLGANVGTKILTANTERVEILKGPATLLYGQAEPGGIVNVVRKAPKEDQHLKLGVIYGTGNKKNIYLDLNDRLFSSESNNLFRFVYANESQDRLGNLTDIDRELLSSSIEIPLTQKTLFNAHYEYQSSMHARNQGTIVIAPQQEEIRILAIDLDRSARQARPNFEADFQLLDLSISHDISQNWNFGVKYVRQEEDRVGVRTQNNILTLTDILGTVDDLSEEESLPLPGVALDGSPITIPVRQTSTKILSVFDEDGKGETDFLRFSVEGSALFSNMDHHISAGIEARREEVAESFLLEEREDVTSILSGEAPAPVNIENLMSREQDFIFYDYGIYFQDSIELSDYLTLSLGSRYAIMQGERNKVDAAEQGERNKVDAADLDFETYNELASQLGLSYKPVGNLSFYFNYSEAVRANYQVDDEGTSIPFPERSAQIELGSKILIGSKFLANFSVFNIDKENIVDVSFEDGLRRSVLGGEQNIKGIDLDFSYNLARNTHIIGAMSLLDPEIVSGSERGNRPALVAEKTASIFINHRVSSGIFNNLELKLGGQFVGDRYGDDENTVLINEYAIIDAGLSYPFELLGRDHKLGLNIKNVTDEEFFTSVEGGIRRNIGAERIVNASLDINFW